MGRVLKFSLWLGLLSAAALLLSFVFELNGFLKPLAVLSAISLAIGLRAIPALKGYQYTAWIIVAIVCGMVYPLAFLKLGGFDLRNKWVILFVIQIVMFGMGTQMSIRDFANIKSMGKGVLIGILCQFSIMPLVGYLLTRVFHFEPEIAAGIILIGSCSSGLASNVMAYLARANLSLSVTLTAVATMLAPIMTPFWMKVLAGTLVEVNFTKMCMEIVQIVIVPIGAAMLYDVYRLKIQVWIKRINIASVFSFLWLSAQILGVWKLMDANFTEGFMTGVALFNFLTGAVLAGKLFYHATVLFPKISSFMPVLSMFGIVYFTVVTTAASRENILAIGFLLLLVAVLHNSLGYVLGYWFSRALGLDKNSCRTVALEVGLQNGGMASGLAGVMGKLATLGLAAAIFSPWMNISGSVLGNYWRRNQVKTG
jgi:bile acid:Na+ symporter, BASS family